MKSRHSVRAVVTASLASYDGSAGFLVDTNVWVDCIDEASPWHAWAVEQLQSCSERSPLHVNLIIYTELLVPRPDVDALDALLDVYDTLRSPLPWACASLTATVLSLYRLKGGLKHKPSPDFSRPRWHTPSRMLRWQRHRCPV